MEKRILALDIGEKRIGVAVTDPFNIMAQPLPYILNDDQTKKEIENLIEEKNIKLILIGLPKDQMGKEGKSAQKIKTYCNNLKLNIPITYYDERYSTKAANKHLLTLDIKRKKRKELIDSQAAAFILEGYLQMN